MLDRVSFINSISGVDANLISQFFDQFIGLSTLLNEYENAISVVNSGEKFIEFQVDFKDEKTRGMALDNILRPDMIISVYNRPINVSTEILADTSLKIRLE